jgi:WD40 repeat protein/serine/threonine protein kinase
VAQLEHLHIVPLYDYWRDPEGAYLVMRLMKGGSLEDVLRENVPLDLPYLVKVVDQITSALAAAHQGGVVHRDLKPANILLDEDGNAYLSDFGIAKALGAQGGMTATGAILGTPAYISPEQVQSLAVSPQTDIYALGVVLYELLTGEHPFPDTPTGSLIIKHAHEPLPLAHEMRPELPREVDEVIQKATAKDPAARYLDALTLASELRRALQLEVIIAEAVEGELINPYKGLRAFQEADVDDFFGRQDLTNELIARLEEDGEYSRFLAVVGPSGSGKSSVVKAGLIPALRKGALPGSEQWFIIDMIPKSHPIEELDINLSRISANPNVNVGQQLARDKRGLLRSGRMVLPKEDGELLLVVDQFEENFTLVEDKNEARHFMDLIFTAVSDAHSQVRVIITLRADFYDRPLMYPDFSRLVKERTSLVIPLTTEELEEAIRAPAERVGAVFEKGLVPAVITDVVDQPGALPLLQYALTELFERREGRRLTNQGYESIGGVLGALGRRAEQVYSGLEEEQKETTRQLFLRLVTLGEGVEDTRRRVLRSQVETLQATSPQVMAKVIDAYSQARLLTLDHDPLTRGPTLEVAHEALLREWDRLQIWLEESRSDLRTQRSIARAEAEWQAAGQDSSFLLRGSRLAQFEDWMNTSAVALTTEERKFLSASMQARQERMATEKERRNRELEQISIGLAAQALQELEGPSPERSVLLALEALENYPYTWQAERALGQAILQDRLCMVLTHDAFINTASWSQDETQILTGSADGTVRLWEVASGEELWRITAGRPNMASWSPDFKSILLINEKDTLVKMWDFDSHAERFSLNIKDLKGKLDLNINTWNPWSPSSEFFLLYTTQGKVYVFDTLTGHLLNTLSNHQGIVSQAFWSPDGELIATSGLEDSKIIIWSAETGKELYTLQPGFEDEKVIFANWSPFGDRFAIRGLGGAKVYESVTGKQLLNLKIPQVWVQCVNWSPDSALIITTGKHDGIARVWDAESGMELSTIEGLVQAYGANWSPSGNYAIVAGADGIVHLWERTTLREIEKLHATSAYIQFVEFSPDGKRVLAYGGDNTVNILDTSTAEITFHNLSHGNVTNVAWSPDGSQFAFGILVPPDFPIKIWDSTTGDQLQMLSGNEITGFISWSPEGGRILTTNHEPKIWDAATGEQLLIFSGHKDEIWDADWSPDGKQFATASQDGEIIIWNTSTGDASLKYSDHQDSVLSVAWSPDGSRILSTSYSGEATIWDAADSKVLIQLLPEDYNNHVPDAKWSHDGMRVFVLTAEGHVLTFNARTGAQLSQFSTTPVSFITCFSLSPSEERILIGGHEGTVKVWNVSTGTELISYEARGFAMASYSPDGMRILTGSTEGNYGTLQVFPTWQSTQELIDYAKKHKVFRQLTVEERELFGLPPL